MCQRQGSRRVDSAGKRGISSHSACGKSCAFGDFVPLLWKLLTSIALILPAPVSLLLHSNTDTQRHVIRGCVIATSLHNTVIMGFYVRAL